MASIPLELPASDPQRAGAFYEQVFGWSLQPLPEVDRILLMERAGDTDAADAPGPIVGGITPRNQFVRAPVPIIGVASIKDALQRVGKAGGRPLTAKEQVGDFGFSSYIEDTEGNVLCLWQDIPAASSLKEE